MVLIFIALLVALAAAVCAIYLGPRVRSNLSSDRALRPPTPRGLFGHPGENPERAKGEAADEVSRRHSVLTKRASEGDLAALRDAGDLGDAKLCRDLLDLLVEQAATRRETLRALVSEVASSNTLRANIRLAELAIEAWKHEPTQRSTAETLHVAALSDDAQTYQAAVDLAVEYWRNGRLTRLSAEDLIALVESQYWVLSSEARSSGAGFALKQGLAGVRRELTTAASTR
jgi:hypothetical protein